MKDRLNYSIGNTDYLGIPRKVSLDMSTEVSFKVGRFLCIEVGIPLGIIYF